MKRIWIKLYVEILDDEKLCELPPWLKWRFVEFLLVAAERDEAGALPPVKRLAWRLRADEKDLLNSLLALAKTGVVHEARGLWKVTNWEKRQAAMSGAERAAQYRDRHDGRHGEVTDSVTESDETSNEMGVTDSTSSSSSVSSGRGNGGGKREAEEQRVRAFVEVDSGKSR